MARADFAAFQEQRRIAQHAALAPGRADQHGRAARALAGEGMDRRHRQVHRRGLQHQVFRRIAKDEMFRQHHQIGAARLGLGHRPARQHHVAGNIADHRIELRRQDSQIFAHVEHLGGGGMSWG
jgi:hypothetical protein